MFEDTSQELLLHRLSEARISSPRDVNVVWDEAQGAFVIIPELRMGLSGGSMCRGGLSFAGFEAARQRHIQTIVARSRGKVIVCYCRDTTAHPFPAPFIIEPAPSSNNEHHYVLRPTEAVPLTQHGATYHFPDDVIGPADSWQLCGYKFLAQADVDFIEGQSDDDLLVATVGLYLDLLCKCASDYIDGWSLQQAATSTAMSSLVASEAELLQTVVADVCANSDLTLPTWAHSRLMTWLADRPRLTSEPSGGAVLSWGAQTCVADVSEGGASFERQSVPTREASPASVRTLASHNTCRYNSSPEEGPRSSTSSSLSSGGQSDEGDGAKGSSWKQTLDGIFEVAGDTVEQVGRRENHE